MIAIKIKKSQVFSKTIQEVTSFKKTIHLGFFSSATYKDGTPVTLVARANNYGTLSSGGHIPPRPFLTTLPGIKKKEWAEYLGMVINEELGTHGNASRALKVAQEALAERAKNDLQDAIVAWNTPPNAPSTIKRKKSSNPLIDTGFLKGSATYVIR